MSEQIVLEWFRDRVSVLDLVGESGRHSVRCAATQDFSDLSDPAIPVATAGEELRGWLTRLHVGMGSVILVIPRESVVMRRLQLPQAPADELPDLVRFQAATRTSASIDSLALDYLTLDRDEQSAGQDVITFTLDREQLARMRSVCEAAGLDVRQVTLSSLSISHLVRTAAAPQVGQSGPELVIFQQGSRIELSILDEGTLVFSHATRLLPVGEADPLKPLRSELTRSLVALEQSHATGQIGRCYYVSGTADSAVIELLQKRCPEGVVTVDTTSLVAGGGVAGFESLLGAALPYRDDRLRIDLLHPRRRREIPDRRRWYYGGTAAAVVLLLLIGLVMFYATKSTLQQDIKTLADDLEAREEQLEKGNPRAQAYARVANWKQGDADVVQLWNQLRAHLPGTERLYFTEWRFQPQGGANVARIIGRGHARERTDVESLNQALSEKGFQVKPTTPSLGKRDPDYPWHFELDVELPRPAESTDLAAGKPSTVNRRSPGI